MTKNTKKKTKVLVIGARGSFGGALLRNLVGRDEFDVSALVRPTSPFEEKGVRRIDGDATDRQSLMQATRGVDVIVYGLNVPYSRWAKELVPAARTLVEVAAERKARVVYPGNVYGLGPDFDEPLNEECRRNAPTEKGRIRNEVEEILRGGVHHGARLLIVRAGDFFGPHADSSWFAYMARNADGKGAVSNPETAPVPHCWAFLPDLAESVVRLLLRQSALGACEEFHFAGHVATPSAMAEEVSRSLGGRKVAPIPWTAMRVASWFSPDLREMIKMRYLWRQPVLLDQSKLEGFLGELPQTSLARAVERSLSDSAPVS